MLTRQITTVIVKKQIEKTSYRGKINKKIIMTIIKNKKELRLTPCPDLE